MKRILPAVIVVYVIWVALDYIIHGVLLMDTYEATSSLWRSQEEMKTYLIYLTTFIHTTTFVLLYSWFVSNKNVMRGLYFGLLFGIGSGIYSGYMTYATMPVPYSLAITWFLGTTIQAGLSGLATGAIVKS